MEKVQDEDLKERGREDSPCRRKRQTRLQAQTAVRSRQASRNTQKVIITQAEQPEGTLPFVLADLLLCSSQIFNTFVPDRGETTGLKRESGGKPELCPQRYIL